MLFTVYTVLLTVFHVVYCVHCVVYCVPCCLLCSMLFTVFHVVLIAHLQGAIQLACLRKVPEDLEVDVAQRGLCDAFPFQCSTAEAGQYCSSLPAVTEQPAAEAVGVS